MAVFVLYGRVSTGRTVELEGPWGRTGGVLGLYSGDPGGRDGRVLGVLYWGAPGGLDWGGLRGLYWGLLGWTGGGVVLGGPWGQD